MKNFITLFTLLIAVSLILTACNNKKEEQAIEEATKVIEKAEKKVKKVSEQSKYLQAMKDIRTISLGMSSYLFDNGKFPAWDNIKTVASDKNMKFHLKNLPVKDPWGKDYLIKCDGEKFWVATAGSDGKFNGFHQTGTFSSYEDGKDIINKDGVFALSPSKSN